MRTTLTIDDDVLLAAKELARQQNKSIGETISDLARSSLRRPQSGRTRGGIPLLKSRDRNKPVTLELVNQLRDELP
jgi:hypothetical protein